MKQLRRLDVTTRQDPYHRALRSALRHIALSEDDYRSLERERPDHIVVEGDAVLIGLPTRYRIDLHYAFPDRDAFIDQFPPMFQRLLPAVSQEDAPLGFRLRLTHAPSRPYVEPMLFAHAFELTREWIAMTLVELPEDAPPSDEIAPGFLLRPARPGDAEAIVRLEDLVFPTSVLTVQLVREAMRSAAYWVLEERGSGELVGSLLTEQRGPATGHIATIAVHPRYQRRGLGEAMLRWALARFRANGLRSASLTVSTWNSPAIALYRKLGFAPSESGWDYRRPIGEEEVRRVLEQHRTSHIRVRRRV